MTRFDDLVKRKQGCDRSGKAGLKRLIAIPTEDAEVSAALDLDLRS